MKKPVTIMIAGAAALAVVFAGATSFACGNKCSSTKTASSVKTASCCPAASAGCGSKAALTNAEYTSTASGSCGDHTSASWASTVCGSKGYYAANVYEVRDGRMWAVCAGQKFEVTENTPYMQIGEARYYVADEASKRACEVKKTDMAAQLSREAVALATIEGNVIGVENGQKVAQCVVTGKKFPVTADSPVMVADGKKYYVSDTTDLSTLAAPTHQ